MKASLTLREEKSPLIKIRFPVSLARFQVNSGIVLGDNKDLALHIGTNQETYPSLKVAYHPNESSFPVRVVLKAGLGPWGPPCRSALSLSAQVRLSKDFTGPTFTLHIKPRIGDFSLRREITLPGSSLPLKKNPGNVLPSVTVISSSAPNDENVFNNAFHDRDPQLQGNAVQLHHSTVFHDAANSVTPLKIDKRYLFTPAPQHKRTGIHDSHSSSQPGVDPWVNDYIRIDHFNCKTRRRPSFDSSFKAPSEGESPHSTSVDEGLLTADHGKERPCKNGISTPIAYELAAEESMKGWNLHAHTSLLFGKQASVDILWGVKGNGEILQIGENNLTNIKFPYLYLQKISLSSHGSVAIRQSHSDANGTDSFESLSEEDQIGELSPVSALCRSMKRQIHLLRTENQVLKKSMEEMKLLFEQRSNGKFRKTLNSYDDNVADGQLGLGTRVSDHVTKWGRNQLKDSMSKRPHNDMNGVSDKSSYIPNGMDVSKKWGIFGLFRKKKSETSSPIFG